jgi:two-component system, NarL family, response regulator NreC
MNVLLADDSVPVRWALRTFVQEQLGWTVVGEAADAEALLAAAVALRPDLILLEWDLPGQPARDHIHALHRQLDSCRIVVLNDNPERRGVALRAGADAFICKIGRPQEVLTVLADFSANSARRPRSHGPNRIYQTQS